MSSTGLYRAVWRWHFFAGLIVLPVLAWLAVTGAIYIYKPELERAIYARMIDVPVRPALPMTRLIAYAEQAAGGHVASVERPAEAGTAWRMQVRDAKGKRLTAFIDPGTGNVTGTLTGGGVMQTVKNLHSLAITGPVGNAVVEIVAGWAILLVLSGLYLWWPRKSLTIRGKAKGRLFWRDLHASTGLLAGGVILFLAFTGMPWTQVWGSGLRSAVAAAGAGRPKLPEVKAALPWTLQEAGIPAGGRPEIDADRASAIAAKAGFVGGYLLVLPASPGAPWLVASQVRSAEDARALFIDAGTGRVLQDSRFVDFGAGAKAVEWGIATHQGQEYGEVNRLVMLAGCLATLLLCATAPVLWWKRGRHVPPLPDRPGALRGVAAIMLGLGVVFPLTGATMVAALAGEEVRRRLRG